MSIFTNILNKLGIKKSEEEEAPVADAKSAAKPAPKKVDVRRTTSKHSLKKSFKKPSAKVATEAMEMVDVMKKLESMGKDSGLNWKNSIVDLLKVLGIDSSLSSRKELAKELACPADLMGDSAKMNTWLHKTVLQKIAENGGNVPQDLLD